MMSVAKIESDECMAAEMPKLVRSTSYLGRKRVMMVDPNSEPFQSDWGVDFKLEKQNSKRLHVEKSTNRLEDLPLDILVRVLCKAGHSDLRQLLLVSKYVNEAVSIARETHFKFSTPSMKPVFKRQIVEDDELGDSVDAPNAPRQRRFSKSRLDAKKLSSIAVALFAEADE